MGMTTEPTRDSRKTKESADRAGSDNPARSAQKRAGSTVLGAAANKARSGVHGVANRLDRVATSSTASSRSAAGGLAATAGTATDTAKGAVKTTAGTATDTVKGAVTTLTTVAKPLLNGVGAAFALAVVVRKIMLFLQFLRQLALQVLEALRQLALRLREAAARRRGGEQEAIEDEAFDDEAFDDEAVEDEEAVVEEAAKDRSDRREPAARPAPRPQSEGQRPQRPVRPRRDVNAPQPDAPAPTVRRAPVSRRPTRLGRRGLGAGGRGE
jgi:hypothetical protein